MDFAAIASEVLAVLEDHDMSAVGLAISFTYSAATFNGVVAASNREAVLDRRLDFHGQSKGVKWSAYIDRGWMDSEGNMQPGTLRRPEDPLARSLTPEEKRLLEETLRDLYHLFKKCRVPFANFQVDAVLSGAEFDRLFQSQEDTPVLERAVRYHITVDEGQGTLQIPRAIAAADLGFRSGS